MSSGLALQALRQSVVPKIDLYVMGWEMIKSGRFRSAKNTLVPSIRYRGWILGRLPWGQDVSSYDPAAPTDPRSRAPYTAFVDAEADWRSYWDRHFVRVNPDPEHGGYAIITTYALLRDRSYGEAGRAVRWLLEQHESTPE